MLASDVAYLKLYHYRDLRIHIERVLCETLLWPVMYWLKIGIVKARKLGVSLKIFLISKMLQDYGNRLADICHASWAGLGRVGLGI